LQVSTSLRFFLFGSCFKSESVPAIASHQTHPFLFLGFPRANFLPQAMFAWDFHSLRLMMDFFPDLLVRRPPCLCFERPHFFTIKVSPPQNKSLLSRTRPHCRVSLSATSSEAAFPQRVWGFCSQMRFQLTSFFATLPFYPPPFQVVAPPFDQFPPSETGFFFLLLRIPPRPLQPPPPPLTHHQLPPFPLNRRSLPRRNRISFRSVLFSVPDFSLSSTVWDAYASRCVLSRSSSADWL